MMTDSGMFWDYCDYRDWFLPKEDHLLKVKLRKYYGIEEMMKQAKKYSKWKDGRWKILNQTILNKYKRKNTQKSLFEIFSYKLVEITIIYK